MADPSPLAPPALPPLPAPALPAITDQERQAVISAAKDVITILALLVAAIFLALNDQAAMAGSALGGALTLAMPSRAGGGRVPPLAAGLALGGLFGAIAGA